MVISHRVDKEISWNIQK